VQLKMREVGVLGVQLTFVRLIHQDLETARIFPAAQNCKELLFMKPDHALHGFSEQGKQVLGRFTIDLPVGRRNRRWISCYAHPRTPGRFLPDDIA